MSNLLLPTRTVALFLLIASIPLFADDWPQWRGPQRNGISQETGLLKEWPPEGPKLVWKVNGIGSGYSTPAVVSGRLYLLANDGLEEEFAQALDAGDGKRLWRTRIGKVGNPDQKPNYAATRSTPSVDGELLYALGSDGDLACLETATGQVRWQMNLRADFAGTPGTWAYAESPLIDGDALICTPGGKEASMISLRKLTGEIIWKCALEEADRAAYASAIVVETGGIRQYVQLLQNGLVGVEARTGKVLWRYPRAVSRFNANIPSPTASGNLIYVASAGTGGGAVRLNAGAGDIDVEELYFSPKFPTAIGGTVSLGEFVYGATGQGLLCFHFTSGQVSWSERGVGPASLLFADGRLYLHGENGEVALVEPSPEGYREKGRFTPPDQPERINPTEKAWAYPVVANGRLYIRDHGTIWSYAVNAAK